MTLFTEIAAILLTMCIQTGFEAECPTLIENNNIGNNIIAAHAVGKTGGEYILVDMGEMEDMTPRTIKGVLIHELAHSLQLADTPDHKLGKMMNHGKIFTDHCRALQKQAGIHGNHHCRAAS